ncbi:MAG: hypothetical protein HYS18_12245 [Burkholderiales bacterium]|nr:hypothetical protein [Burkholderiales bacterium]
MQHDQSQHSIGQLDKVETKGSSKQAGNTILWGLIISMVGIVIYFFVMSRGDQQADLLSALNANGAIGLGAVMIIFVGLGLWFAGSMEYLDALGDEGQHP